MTSRMLLAITIVALAGTAALAGNAPASHGFQAVTVGIDVDPDAAPANSATSLGTIEGCTSVTNSAGSRFTIDVFLNEIPSGQDMAGFNYQLNFDDTRFKVADQDHSLLLASAPGSMLTDLSEEAPDADSPHAVAPVDLAASTAEQGPASGVLGRYTLEVLPAAPDGVGDLFLANVGVFNTLGESIPINQTLAGLVALGSACSEEPPSPTTPPKPTPSPKPEATSPEGTPAPDAPPPADATPPSAVLDADDDGVPDASDQCPGDATGDAVDASGCSETQLGQLTEQAEGRLLETASAGLNLDVSLETVAVGGSTIVLAAFADDNDEPISGVDITFSIETQPGSDANLEDEAELTKTSDSEGVAKATLNVGSDPGEIVVSATAEGQTETVTITVVGAGEASPAQNPTAGAEPTPIEGASSGAEEEDGGGTSAWPYVVGGVVIALAALGGGVWWLRRRATGGL